MINQWVLFTLLTIAHGMTKGHPFLLSRKGTQLRVQLRTLVVPAPAKWQAKAQQVLILRRLEGPALSWCDLGRVDHATPRGWLPCSLLSAQEKVPWKAQERERGL